MGVSMEDIEIHKARIESIQKLCDSIDVIKSEALKDGLNSVEYFMAMARYELIQAKEIYAYSIANNK